MNFIQIDSCWTKFRGNYCLAFNKSNVSDWLTACGDLREVETGTTRHWENDESRMANPRVMKVQILGTEVRYPA